MFAIEAIKFNRDTGAATHDALNLRKNATQFISAPEWRRFVCVNPEDSRAAYAIAPTRGNPISIEVSLSTTDPSAAFIEVRAERRDQYSIRRPFCQLHCLSVTSRQNVA